MRVRGCLIWLSVAKGLEGSYPLIKRQSNQLPQRRKLKKRLTNNSKDLSLDRVSIRDFSVVLAKTPNELTLQELDRIYGQIETVVSNHLSRVSNLEYVFLSEMTSRFRNEQTTVAFPQGGVAAFLNASSPSENELELWVKEALEEDLPTELQTIGFNTVRHSLYLSDRSRTYSPAEDKMTTDNANRVGKVGLVASTAVAGIAALALLTIFVKWKRSQTHVEGALHLQDASHDRHIPRSAVATGSKRVISSASIAGSESSFTVKSEDGDSLALKALSHQGHGLVQCESFEQDVKVNLRKDMLTSAWVSQPPLNLRGAQMDSVLKPSHFSAFHERHQRQLSRTERTQGRKDPMMRFQSSQGDDCYLENASRVSASQVDRDLV